MAAFPPCDGWLKSGTAKSACAERVAPSAAVEVTKVSTTAAHPGATRSLFKPVVPTRTRVCGRAAD